MKSLYYAQMKNILLIILAITLATFNSSFFTQATLPVSRTTWNSGAPTGWTDNGTGSYTSSFACSGNNAGKMDGTGDYYQVFFSNTPDQLTFKLKSASMNAVSSCLLEESANGSTWSTLGTYTTANITTCGIITHTLNSSTRYVRWTYTKSSGNCSIDDVDITAGVVSCTPPTITSVTPASGPEGTLVTISASGGGFTGATDVTFDGIAATFSVNSATEIEAIVPSGATTGDIVVTDSQPCDATYSSFTIIDTDITSCEGSGSTFSDLFISEIYDAGSGDTYYYEIYNGTGASVNLANYRILQRQNGGATTYTTTLSGTLADGDTYVIGNSNTTCSGVRDLAGHSTGINDNDGVFLQKNTGSWNTIDRWGNDTGTSTAFTGGAGYTYARKTAPVNTPPYTGWDETGDWDQGAEDCSDLGNYTIAGAGVAPTVTTHPSTSTICSGSDAQLTVAGSEGHAGGNSLAYQWYESAPGASGWTALSNGGVYSGVTSATLQISPAQGYDGYQYYCQIREDNASCYEASDAVQLDVYGSSGTAGLWQGTIDDDWHDCFNWDDGFIPTSATDVIINQTASNNCRVSTADAECNSITLTTSNGTTNDLEVRGGRTLDVTNNVSITRTANGTGNLKMEAQASSIINIGGNLTATINNGITSAAEIEIQVEDGSEINVTGNTTLTNNASDTDPFVWISVGVAGANPADFNTTNLTLNGNGTGNTTNTYLEISSDYAHNFEVRGDFLMQDNARLDLDPSGSNPNIYFGGDFSNQVSAAQMIEGTSTITFNGATDQNINTNAFTESFNNVTIDKSGGTIVLQDDISLLSTGVLSLGDDQLQLNNNELTINNTNTGAITRTSGSIVDESGTASGINNGKINWVINSVSGDHIFPFADGVGGTYIPFTFNRTSGNAGTVTVSTYGTPASNAPWPSAPDVVTNLASTTGLTPDNRDATADRFWQIDPSGNPTATITFSYAASELPTSPYNDPFTMIAQRYDTGADEWDETIFSGQTRGTITGGYYVSVPGITSFSPWTLSNLASPLPAELTLFEAKENEDKVDLNWMTESEINVSHFIIERSPNAIDFQEILAEDATGNSSTTTSYQTTDYHPLKGISFYRLKTVDFNGNYKYSAPQQVQFGNNDAFVLTDANNWTIYYETNSSRYTVNIFNSLGQIIQSETVENTSENKTTVSHQNIAVGTYIMIIEDKGNYHTLKLIK